MAYGKFRRFIELAAMDRPWVGKVFGRRRKSTPPRDANANWDWDSDYASGVLDRLWRNDQRHHHRLLASLLAGSRPNPAVLDIGCGEGAFYHTIALHRPSAYLGVDVSKLAIERAREKAISTPIEGPVRFETGDGSAFETEETFDFIVFSECAEFLGDMSKVMDHYRKNLREGGKFGVTMWLATRQLPTWELMKAHAKVEDEAIVCAAWGGAWIVAVLSPR